MSFNSLIQTYKHLSAANEVQSFLSHGVVNNLKIRKTLLVPIAYLCVAKFSSCLFIFNVSIYI